MKEENTYNEQKGTNLPDYLRVNPFNVPKGYFEDLEETVFAKITEQKLKEKFAESNFSVPEGYFENLEDQIQSKLFEQELKDQSTETGFTVPVDYFENSQTHITTRIAELKLKDAVPTDGYGVPANYFDGLTQDIMSAIQVEQMASSQESNFAVPHNYFETLSSKIMDKVADQTAIAEEVMPDTPVVRMPYKRSWSQYAAAAAIALIVSVGSYWALDSSKQAQVNANTQMALHEISNEDIFNYLTQVTDGVELIELATFLQEGGTDRPFDVNGQVEDQEIEEYLNYML